jgi:hypothetical protein
LTRIIRALFSRTAPETLTLPAYTIRGGQFVTIA